MDESGKQLGRGKFPTNFLFGAATASHQVEGDNRYSDWWEYEQAGLMPFESGQGCDHYHRYKEDFDLAKSWGHNCHRLSVEWSRIEPQEGEWNEVAVAHYIDVFDALRQRNIQPIVTLNHFTLPAWFLRRGGWIANDAPAIFARFAGRFVKQAGKSVSYWLTINEPTVYVQQAYINGEWPPLKSRSWIAAIRVLRNLARAHSMAYSEIKSADVNAVIGFAHSAMDIQPCDPRRLADRSSSATRNFFLNSLFFRLIGMRANRLEGKRPNLDFIGINYYSRCCVTAGAFGPSWLIGRACKLDHHADSGARSSTGWEMYPTGLARMLEQFSAYELPMLVTENGIATDNDQLRCQFLTEHLRVISNTLAEGKNILGYVHWSLIDNFEWHHGFAARFGLAEVDFETLERRKRPSAELFSQICRERHV
jgi:beta-glucosidase